MPQRPASGDREIFGMIPPGNLLAFSLVTMLFLIWGIPNNMNDILIKQFMKSFELSRFQAVLIQSAFYMGYFVLAIPAGLLMKKYSYKTGLVVGLLLFSTGCFLFWPAAVVGKYGLFLLALFVIASGLSFLETGANGFMVEIGAEQSAERRINFAQAFNSIGAILSVLVGTVFILSGIEHDKVQIAALKAAGTYDAYLHKETMRVVTPYVILAVFGLFWAICMLFTRFPKARDEQALVPKGRWQDLGKKPHFIGGVIAQFFYVGAQVATWSFFIAYTQEYTHQPEKTAGYFLTGTLIAFMLGRFSATWFMKFLSPGRLMGLYALINIGLVGLAIVAPGQVGFYALFLTSFFMSLMFPTIFALSVRDLGPNAKVGGGIVIMAIVGGAALPPVMGLIAVHNLALSLIVPLLAYVVIAWYAYKGSVIKASV
jgi:MFS transporter, FHS family, L-fucose permease